MVPHNRITLQELYHSKNTYVAVKPAYNYPGKGLVCFTEERY
jgi:hypothetical protein